MKQKNYLKDWKFWSFITFLLVLVFMINYFDLYRYVNPEFVKAKIAMFGILAPLAFILIYIIATILVIPGTPLTLLAGAFFGTIFGTLYVVIGSVLGACLAFLIARVLGKDFVDNLS